MLRAAAGVACPLFAWADPGRSRCVQGTLLRLPQATNAVCPTPDMAGACPPALGEGGVTVSAAGLRQAVDPNRDAVMHQDLFAVWLADVLFRSARKVRSHLLRQRQQQRFGRQSAARPVRDAEANRCALADGGELREGKERWSGWCAGRCPRQRPVLNRSAECLRPPSSRCAELRRCDGSERQAEA